MTRRVPARPDAGIRELLDRHAHALGDRVRALEIGVRQDQRHLLTTVAGRGVGVARALAQHARHLLEHDISLLMAVGVVDRLKLSMSSMISPTGWW